MKKPSVSFHSAFFNSRVLLGFMLCTLGVFLALFAFGAFLGGPALAQGQKQNQDSAGSHKVSVSDRQMLDSLKSQGARVISDYGSYVLLEVNDAVAKSLANNDKAQIVDEHNQVLLNAVTINTTTAEAQAARYGVSGKSGNQMRLIQFAGPIRSEWYQALVNTGVRIVTYIPNNAYLVYGAAQNLEAVRSLASDKSVAQWDGDYPAAYRLDPAVTGPSKTGTPDNLSSKGNEQFIIQLVDDADENKKTLELIDQLKLEPIISQDKAFGYINVKVALPKDAVIQQIAERGDVVSIQQWSNPRLNDERQDIILSGNLTGNSPTPMNYLTYLTGKGFDVTTSAGFTVNLSDSGVDIGSTTPNHFGLYRVGNPVPANSRITYARRVPAGGGTIQGCDGHGTENAHIIGGYVPTGTVGGVNFGAFPHADASGFRYGLGMAPFVKIGSSVIFDPSFTSPVYQNLESTAYADGARISSNSWGNTSGNTYNSDSQAYDFLVRDAQPDSGCVAPACISTPGNQEYTILFAAGNSGSGANTVHPPATAKNIITVGAAENVQAFGGSDGCGTTDAEADSANDIVAFSSRGPTSDQRKKPDIMGPGTHVSGGVGQASIASPAGSGNGVQLACFNGSGVCGGVGSNFFPAGQQWWTASSGTSHSCPATAGAAALIRQHFINQGLTPPSPAMTKGLIMNAARYMNGTGANDTLPSNNQGMGEVNMNSYFDIFATPHSFHDEVPAEMFTASGQERNFTGSVSSAAKPFRVTLVWTDAPGPTSGNAFVNNLDLEVTVGGNTYKGNVFTGAFSSTGGTADIRNNVESVFVPAGASGSFQVKVKGTNIAGNGVPNNASPLDQDYSLVIYNGTESPQEVIGSGGSSIVSAGANGVLDPGETVTVSLGLINVGAICSTSALTGTLQPTGGVTSPSGAQNYGAICSGNPAVFRNFTFTVDPALPCGSTVTASLAIQDGATNLGVVTYTFTTGTTAVAVSQNFDGVVAPALPAGWTTVATGAESPWVTSTTTPSSAPNDAFAPDPATVGNTELISNTFAVAAGGGTLSFKNLYNMESTYDGVVLEISINAGAFADIITVGGSFVSGGYTGPISTAFMSPIAGRQAWTGLSGGTTAAPTYITTVVTMPPSANGQNVQLKWRAATDSSVAAAGVAGVRIDDISLSSPVCEGVAPVPSSAVSRKVHGAAGPFDINLPLVPVTGAVGIEDRTGPTFQIVVTFPSAVTVGSAAVTTGTGSATFSVSGAVVTINLTGVTDVQRLGVTLSNVASGSSVGNVLVPMGILSGDTNGSGSVTAADVSQTKGQSGNTTVAGNFRTDVNASGSISAADVALVKARSGAVLPP